MCAEGARRMLNLSGKRTETQTRFAARLRAVLMQGCFFDFDQVVQTDKKE